MAALGGAYPSIVTTVVLASAPPRSTAASALGHHADRFRDVYLRLAALVGLFIPRLFALLGIPFVMLAAPALGVGWLWSGVPGGRPGQDIRHARPRNPLELGGVFLFRVLFLAMLVVRHRVVVASLGSGGFLSLAAVMGVTDVDPFIMGLTQAAPCVTHFMSAAVAILVAASSNNLVKGVYAYAALDRNKGVMSLGLLVDFSIAGLAPVVWLWHQ